MSEKISVEEWLAALANADKPSDDAQTITAWAKRMECSRDRAAAWVAQGLDNGWMERATIVVTELNGRERRAIGFRLEVEQEEKPCSS